jgi:hydrogenase maturation protease
MSRTLVIGYGNPHRNDDGVAYEVVGALRRRLGQASLGEEETGLEQLGAEVDSIFVLQLAPELLDVAADYDQVIFVDAHVHTDRDALDCQPVQPEYATAAFTHHMTPPLFLALLQALHRCQPQAHTVSIQGQSFDFRRGLSAAAGALVQPAVTQILALAQA